NTTSASSRAVARENRSAGSRRFVHQLIRPMRRLPSRQLCGDLTCNLVGQIDIRTASLGSHLDFYRRDLRIERFDPYPNISLVDLALDCFHGVRLAMQDALTV